MPSGRAWGPNPFPFPCPDLYKSLKEGKADASEGDLTQISSFKLNEVQSHLTMTNHLVQTGGILINSVFFEKLAKKDQMLILKAAKEASDWAQHEDQDG